MEHQLTWMREQIGRAYHVEGTFPTVWPDSDVRFVVPDNHCHHGFSLESPKDVKRPRTVINRQMFQVKGREVRVSRSKLPSPSLQNKDPQLILLCARLLDDQRNWVRYAYTDNYQWDNEQSIVKEIWNRFHQSLAKPFSEEKTKKLKGLCYLCLQDAKYQKNNDEVFHKPARIRELLDISESNWRRDWLPHWKKFRSIIDDIDSSALKVLLSDYKKRERRE